MFFRASPGGPQVGPRPRTPRLSPREFNWFSVLPKGLPVGPAPGPGLKWKPQPLGLNLRRSPGPPNIPPVPGPGPFPAPTRAARAPGPWPQTSREGKSFRFPGSRAPRALAKTPGKIPGESRPPWNPGKPRPPIS